MLSSMHLPLSIHLLLHLMSLSNLLTVVFEGTLNNAFSNVLLDTSASEDLMSTDLMSCLGLFPQSTDATLQLADGNEALTLGLVIVKLTLGSFHSGIKAYVTDLAHSFDVIVVNCFMCKHETILNFEDDTYTPFYENKMYTIQPPSGAGKLDPPVPPSQPVLCSNPYQV